jgi:hypothetical protein
VATRTSPCRSRGATDGTQGGALPETGRYRATFQKSKSYRLLVISRLRNFFSKNFHRELLDEARSRISMLDEIIHAIEGKIG